MFVYLRSFRHQW